jgi:hypothetical protein
MSPAAGQPGTAPPAAAAAAAAKAAAVAALQHAVSSPDNDKAQHGRRVQHVAQQQLKHSTSNEPPRHCRFLLQLSTVLGSTLQIRLHSRQMQPGSQPCSSPATSVNSYSTSGTHLWQAEQSCCGVWGHQAPAERPAHLYNSKQHRHQQQQ